MGASVSTKHVDYIDANGAVKRAAIVNINVGSTLAGEQRVEIIDEQQAGQKPIFANKNEEYRYHEKMLIDAGMLDGYITKQSSKKKKRRRYKNNHGK